jgi:colanic acid/amylovoran biosynthesis glycosyltransferase
VTLPRTAYVLLWFPKPSETFVFREVVNLRKMGLPLQVFSLYGALTGSMSEEMRSQAHDVERLGLPYLKRVIPDLLYWRKRNPALTSQLLLTVPFRRWNGLEKAGENLWAFLCGFRLARRCEEEGMEHIHAPWASGPATAAWIASRLTGIPFSFTARAWDIYPADGALSEKIRDAAFVRSETRTNISYLASFCGGDTSKFLLTYNGVPLTSHEEAAVPLRPPYRLLALGRFVGKKGYDYLLRAAKILADLGMDFHLTMAGEGPRGFQLKRLAASLGIADRVSFPGFVPYDEVSRLIAASDVLVMPSVVHSSGDRDGIPTVIMECLMHRVPVIATDVSGIAEVIEDAVTGLLIPEKKPEAIAEAVLKMVGDREAALAMAERGRAKVLELFDPERNHRRVLELYQALVPPVSPKQ